MAASLIHLSNYSTSAAADIEPPFLRLPLELRQIIYAIVLGPPQVIKITEGLFRLDDYYRNLIYRPKSKKRHETNVWYHNVDLDDSDHNEDCRSESGSSAHSNNIRQDDYHLSLESMEEWRTGILGVSKVISDEALNVLYGQHFFLAPIHGGAHHQLAQLGISNLRRIRRLGIVARPMGVSYGPESLVLDHQVWHPLLEGLSQFCIVAQQPLQPRGYFGAPTFEEDMDEWLGWLEPILQYLSKNVHKDTDVSLDADERVETSALMDKYFAARYRTVRTVTGDLCFERGDFSLESGYWDSDGQCDNFADCGFGDDWSD